MNPTPIRFGLMPVAAPSLHLARTVLPLKSVHYRFDVRGGIADVEMTQVYCQENAQPLDCEYLFPLPADAAVYRCHAVIDGRVIEARIEERQAAIRMAASRKAEGYRTVLVESERANLFTLSLGNIQPLDVVEIKLAYIQPLRRVGANIALDLPLSPGVRYIPGNPLLRSNMGRGIADDTVQVPDASRITPPRIDGSHPDAALVILEGSIEGHGVADRIQSPTHSLRTSTDEVCVHIALATGGDIPDRDIALRWVERRPALASHRGWISRHGDDAYALLELTAPAGVDSSDAVGQDLYFLVDRSGSMQGLKWQKAVQALHICVAVLNPQDRVWITFFSSTLNDFDAIPQPPNQLMADGRYQRLEELGVNGGTELRPALVHVMEKVRSHSKDRPSALVLITDAQVGNDGAITAALAQYPDVPVHCLGIDSRLNDALLIDIIRQQGGTFHALQPTEDIPAIVAKIGRTFRQPVLVDLQLPSGWEPASRSRPNLYAGQTNLVSLRMNGAAPAKTIQINARNRNGAPTTLDFRLTEVAGEIPRLRWGMERLLTLVAQDRHSAIALSKETNLLCPLTAFVAWDDREKVAIAQHLLVQPSLEADETIRYAVEPDYRGMRGATFHLTEHIKCSVDPTLFSHRTIENVPEHFKAIWDEFLPADLPETYSIILSKIQKWIDSTLPADVATSAEIDLKSCIAIFDRWVQALPGLPVSEPTGARFPGDTMWESMKLKIELRKSIIDFTLRWVMPLQNHSKLISREQ
jgi:Ca-activated chloride channel family protein